ncbi:hypothetical protein DRN34_05325 [Thermococci archaeon]|nr:MAG: hypothetical protein DRN34_05325 [Thermococci archaeon]
MWIKTGDYRLINFSDIGEIRPVCLEGKWYLGIKRIGSNEWEFLLEFKSAEVVRMVIDKIKDFIKAGGQNVLETEVL